MVMAEGEAGDSPGGAAARCLPSSPPCLWIMRYGVALTGWGRGCVSVLPERVIWGRSPVLGEESLLSLSSLSRKGQLSALSTGKCETGRHKGITKDGSTEEGPPRRAWQ